MKKLLFLASAITFLTQSMSAQMRYDLINDLTYSYPKTPDINQHEYRTLLLGCAALKARMETINKSKKPSMKDILSQCEFYLKGVGTPTALRLIADLKANAIYYENGNFMDTLF